MISFFHSQQPSLVQRCSSPHWDKSPQKKISADSAMKVLHVEIPNGWCWDFLKKIGLDSLLHFKVLKRGGDVIHKIKSNKQAESWPLPSSKRFGFSFFLWPSIEKKKKAIPYTTTHPPEHPVSWWFMSSNILKALSHCKPGLFRTAPTGTTNHQIFAMFFLKKSQLPLP